MCGVAFLAGTSSYCYGCANPVLPVLKRCAGCGVARYCTEKCQAADWPEHRQLCKLRDTSLAGFASRNVPDEVLDFLRWFDRWQPSIQRWAVYSADLAHQCPEFLAHNCFVLMLAKQEESSASSAAAMYTPFRFGMRSNTEVLDELSRFPVIDRRRTLLKTFRRAPRRVDSVRILVMTPNCCSVESAKLSCLFPDDQSRLFSAINDAQARSLSTELKLGYLDGFANCVRSGSLVLGQRYLDLTSVRDRSFCNKRYCSVERDRGRPDFFAQTSNGHLSAYLFATGVSEAVKVRVPVTSTTPPTQPSDVNFMIWMATDPNHARTNLCYLEMDVGNEVGFMVFVPDQERPMGRADLLHPVNASLAAQQQPALPQFRGNILVMRRDRRSSAFLDVRQEDLVLAMQCAIGESSMNAREE
ncbi:hypothetical protein C8R47DRAFT_1079750 [Mycena vitilis]|nr:hypothetical protein C8R47DRAFT_1079750 [Mycena vitilis]